MANIYPQKWYFKEDQSGDEEILRVNLSNAQDAKEWVKEFGALNACGWVVGPTYRHGTTSQRYELHQRWLCQQSSFRKSASSRRSTGCKASVDILIKLITKKTKRSDSYLKLSPPLQAVVKISKTHNHATDTLEALRLLRPTDTTKATFEEYFNRGMSAAEARHFHVNKLQENNSTPEMLANSSINPTMNTISFWFMRYRKKKSDYPLTKMADRDKQYEGEGVLVKTAKVADCWGILIVTPTMKRSQSLEASSKIIFIDSTSSCEKNKATTTTMLTASKAGAIPIAVFIHNSQTSESYKTAFRLLVENCPQCFGGNEAPHVFLTDDSSAEKDALRATWSSAIQLLCHFHVCLAEWRWLVSMTRKEDQERLMHAFKKVMNAENQEDLDSAVHDAYQEGGSDYPYFSKRLESYLKRKKEWVLMFRLEGNHAHNRNTNNFAEACLRILKDIILTQTKTLNIVALCDFLISDFETFLATRITTVARDKVADPNSLDKKDCNRMANYDLTRINEVSSRTIYTVPSQSKTLVYEVNVEIGICSCPSGQQGAFCKHQALLHHHLQLPFPTMPQVTSLQRHTLGQLALSEKLLTKVECVSNREQRTDYGEDDLCSGPAPSQPSLAERIARAHEALRSELQRLGKMQMPVSIASVNAMNYLTRQLKKVTNGNQLISFMLRFKRLASQQTRRGGAVLVQSTAIPRRREVLARGSKQVAVDRLANQAPKKKAKTTHNLD